jgi:hypothetical protein
MERLPLSILCRMNDSRLLRYYKVIREKVRMQYRDLNYYEIGSDEEKANRDSDEGYVSYIKSLLSFRGHVNRPIKRRTKCR